MHNTLTFYSKGALSIVIHFVCRGSLCAVTMVSMALLVSKKVSCLAMILTGRKVQIRDFCGLYFKIL